MKSLTYLSILITPLFINAQSKSISFSYVGLELNSPLPLRPYRIGIGVLTQETDQFQNAAFSFKSPSFGLGFLVRNKFFSLKGDVSYWIGKKKLDYEYSYTTRDLDKNFQADGSILKPGDTFYQVDQSFKGTVTFHYLDFTLAAGKTLGKYISLFIGVRQSVLLNHDISGTLTKAGEKYKVISYMNYVPVKNSDFLIQYKNNQVRSRSGQLFTGYQYVIFGLNSTLKFGERNGFIQVDFVYPIFSTAERYRIAYFNLKTGIALFKDKEIKTP